MSKYKIYNVDYLINEDLTEEDLYYLFNTSSLNYSLIIKMFEIAEINKDKDTILNLINSDNYWFNKYFWSANQRRQMENIIMNVVKNLYQYSNSTAIRFAQNWIIKYGLANNSLKKQKITNKNSLYI